MIAAAERLGIAQPAVSAAVRRLEEDLGGPLLVRGGRGVALTPEGAVFLRHGGAAGLERGHRGFCRGCVCYRIPDRQGQRPQPAPLADPRPGGNRARPRPHRPQCASALGQAIRGRAA
ncbi:MAG TPA: LysR family transcriptional regulator [Azospirillum sp.]